MHILMLGAHPGLQGPLPKIVPLLARALRTQGYTVEECGWGKHLDQESWWQMVAGRALDIFRIRLRLSRERPDILFIASALNGRALLRDILLLLATQGRTHRTLLQFHGSRLAAVSQPGQPVFKAAARLLFSLCGGVIVSSQIERQALSQFAPRQQFFVADNIYQPEFCAPSSQVPPDWELPVDKPIVFFAARLIPEKGILDLLTAIPLVLKEIPCHFLLAGGGPLETEVRKRLSRSPWKEHASWVGYLDWPHLELAYNLTSIFVLPTYHDEGFPAVIHDALGHGLPIVTTPIRGLADHLVEGVNACLVSPQNPAELARAIIELLKDPQLRQRMATANREKVVDFSSDVVVMQYLKILQKVVFDEGCMTYEKLTV
jgi:glycosyltransferase involved in cell wall biosynthesis